MQNKITTTHVSLQKKAEILAEQVAKNTPGVTTADACRLTPNGVKMLDAMRAAARKMFVESGDAEWLKAARQLAVSYKGANKVVTANDAK